MRNDVMTVKPRKRKTNVQAVSLPIDFATARISRPRSVWRMVEKTESGAEAWSPTGWSTPVSVRFLGKCWLRVGGRPADFERSSDAAQFGTRAARWLRTAPEVTVTVAEEWTSLWIEVPEELLEGLEVIQ